MSPPRLTSVRRSLGRRNVSGDPGRHSLHAVAPCHQVVDQALPAVTAADVARFLAHVQAQGVAAQTMHGNRSAVRQFSAYVRHDHMPGLVNPVRQRDCLKDPRPVPRAASEGARLNIWAPRRSGRDRARFLVLWRRGIRVSEVVGLESMDVELGRHTLRVREGKNRRERLVDLSPDTAGVLAESLEQRGWPRAGKLFVSDKGRAQGQSLSIRGVQKRLAGYARCAGVRVSGHRLRHRVATQLLHHGVRLVVVHELLGHATVTRTQRDARLANRRVREAYFAGMQKIFGATV
jgi:site-specific recombinase XerD